MRGNMQQEESSPIILVPMKGGDGANGYVHNSTYQRKAVDGAKGMIDQGIAEKFDIKSSPTRTFCVVDLGCSVGPNTLVAMQNIIEAIQQKYQSQSCGPPNPEFQVYFNDHVSNDFNKLFASLPPQREYFAAAVPGSFFDRLFPKGSLHFVHSSTAIHWLSRVPKEVQDVNLPSYNKGKIHHGGALKEVVDAYVAQFFRDMESFFLARAEELVSGGLMALTLLTRPKHTFPAKQIPHPVDVLGVCLMEMADKGILSEGRVDSFNIPVCVPSTEEFVQTIKSNGCFNIEMLELVYLPKRSSGGFKVENLTMHVRAVFESLLSGHFGSTVMDELFLRFTEKASKLYDAQSTFDDNLFVLLKRK